MTRVGAPRASGVTTAIGIRVPCEAVAAHC